MKNRNLLNALTLTFVAGTANATTIAHWTFDSEADFNSGVLTDVTGNGNNMTLESFGNMTDANLAAYSSDTYFSTGGAIDFNGTRNGELNGTSVKTGQYFKTVDSAPVNSMNFDQGYTVEVIFKPVNPFEASENRWMGALSRTGKTSGDPSMAFAISSLGEVQWQTTDADQAVEEAVWSPVLFTPSVTRSSDDYYHVAAVNYQDDNGDWHVDMYINGYLGFRNIVNADHNGIAAYSNSNMLIGVNLWDDTLSSPFNGLIDDIRISDVALDPTQFTYVPEPTSLALLGLGGLLVARRRRG